MKHYLSSEVLSTVLILLASFILIFSSSYLIQRQEWNTIKQKQYLSFIRNLTLIFCIILLFFTWRGEIKALILSISAITVGVFVAFKDIIVSFMSYFIISSNQLFKIGDVLEMDDKVGKVTDRTLLYTKLSLIGPNHGKEMNIPNNIFTVGKFVNLSTQPVYSKSVQITTETSDLKQKVEHLNAIIKHHIADKPFVFDVFIDSLHSQETQIKVVIKEIDAFFDFNNLKNSILIDFLDKWPAKNQLNLQNVE